MYRIYTVGTYIYIYSSKVIPISLDRQLAVSTGHLCRERFFLRLWDGSPLYPLTQKISGHLAELSHFLWCRTWTPAAFCVEIFGIPLADWPTTPSWWSRSIPSLHRDSYPSTPGFDRPRVEAYARHCHCHLHLGESVQNVAGKRVQLLLASRW